MKKSIHQSPSLTARIINYFASRTRRAAATFDRPFPRTTSFLAAATCVAAALCVGGCTLTSYKSPSGEKFTRASLGTTAALTELTVSGDTNGLRTLHLQGYSSDQSQALSAVTSAAVTAALQSAKPAP